MAKVRVIQQPETEVPVEILATAILKVSDAMEALNTSKLNRRALLVLLKDSSGVPYKAIEKILRSLETLKRDYVKP